MTSVSSVSLMDSVSVVPVSGSTATSSQGDFQKYMDIQGSQSISNAKTGESKSFSAISKATGQSSSSGSDSSQTKSVSNPSGSSQDASRSSSTASQRGAGASQTGSDTSGMGTDVSQNQIQGQDFSSETDVQSVTDVVAEAVQDTIEDVLGLDDEALNDLMSQMGLTFTQLLQPETLQELVLEVHSGSDITQLLTSEDMMGEFTQLTQGLEEVDWEALTGMNQKELTSYLDSVLSGENGLADRAADMTVESEVATTQADAFSMVNSTSGQQSQVISDSPVTETVRENLWDVGLSEQETVQTQMVSEEVVSKGDAFESTLTQESDITLEESLQETSSTVLAGERDSQTKSQEKQETLSVVQDTVDLTNDSSVTTLEESSLSDTLDGGGDQTGQQSVFSQSSPATEQDPLFEQPVTTMADFVDNMMQAVSTEQTSEPVNMQQMIDIVNQVVEQIHSTMEDGATTLEMQLNPESLGKLLLSVTNKSGVMTASFTVQTQEAKAALESQMATLRDNLEQKNLKVEAVEVSVSDFAFSHSGQADTGDNKEFQQGNGRRSRFRFDEEEDSPAEETGEQAVRRRSVVPDLGSSIDFTA